LIATLVRLRDLGNTVLIVEHDEAMMRAADWIIDMGPGAGVHGGHVVAQGKIADIAAAEAVGVTIVRYEGADHGFVHDDSRPAHRAEDAADAWQKAIAFLSE